MSTPLSRQENYIHEWEKVLVNSEIRILHFRQYQLATYIHVFQTFIILSQPTGSLVEPLQYVCHFTINFMKHKLRTDQSTSSLQFVY